MATKNIFAIAALLVGVVRGQTAEDCAWPAAMQVIQNNRITAFNPTSQTFSTIHHFDTSVTYVNAMGYNVADNKGSPLPRARNCVGLHHSVLTRGGAWPQQSGSLAVPPPFRAAYGVFKINNGIPQLCR